MAYEINSRSPYLGSLGGTTIDSNNTISSSFVRGAKSSTTRVVVPGILVLFLKFCSFSFPCQTYHLKNFLGRLYQIRNANHSAFTPIKNTLFNQVYLIKLSYHDIILLYSRIHLKWISLCYCAPLGAKTILSQSHFKDDSSPYISWSGSSIRVSHTFVLFKHVTLIWINYLETWLCSDNTSCYYKAFNQANPFVYKYLCVSENKSVFNWTFCQLLKWKARLHGSIFANVNAASVGILLSNILTKISTM